MAKKLLILGLNNSGKTSILLSFRKQTNILSFCSLKPTKNVHVENFDIENSRISIWDFGGQLEYRKKYLAEFENYLEGVDKILYVIDVQDIKRYDEALKYLEEIIQRLQREEQAFHFTIFLHKWDPYIEELEGFEKIEEIVAERLIGKIKAIMPPNFPHEIFKTCIYSIFKKSSL